MKMYKKIILTVMILMLFSTFTAQAEKYEKYGKVITYIGYETPKQYNQVVHKGDGKHFKSSRVTDVVKQGRYAWKSECSDYEQGDFFILEYSSSIDTTVYSDGKIYFEGFFKIDGNQNAVKYSAHIVDPATEKMNGIKYTLAQCENGWIKMSGCTDTTSDLSNFRLRITASYEYCDNGIQALYADDFKTVYIPNSIQVLGGNVKGDCFDLSKLKVLGEGSKNQRSEIVLKDNIKYSVVSGDAYIKNGSVICSGGTVNILADMFGVQDLFTLNFDAPKKEKIKVETTSEGFEVEMINITENTTVVFTTYIFDEDRFDSVGNSVEIVFKPDNTGALIPFSAYPSYIRNGSQKVFAELK